MIEFDVILTPVGPCTAELEDGCLVGLRLGERPPLAGRRRRLANVRRWLRDWFGGKSVEVPMRVEGTPFVRRIYEVVRRIPPGETQTYGEVARAAGHPGAARAVGAAMARNPVCLFIPCHRVVGSGSLGGYSAPGGLATKRRLLDRELAR